MKNILTYRNITPTIDPSAFIASSAILSGDVNLE
jgi:carbonic anhydrase/acetyltransferase-like protein (isoleucine patch superfamily)